MGLRQSFRQFRERRAGRAPAPADAVVHPRRIPSTAQWRMLPTVFRPVEWRIVQSLALLAVVGLAIASVSFLSAHLSTVARRGGSLTEVVVGSPQYVNPLLSTGNPADEALTKLLYAGLMGRSASGELTPVLAERIEANTDGTVFTVHLRPNLQWPDGESFTPDDVLTTVDVLQDARYKLTLPNRLRSVKVERVDDTTLTFTLPASNEQFPSLLTFGILPAHLWANVEPSKFALVEYNLKPVGMGPFAFQELRRDPSGEVKTYTLRRSKSWPRSAAFLDRITLRFVPDGTSALQTLTERSAETYAAENPAEVHTIHRGMERRIPLAQYVAVFLNERGDVWKDSAVRNALSIAADRSALTALPTVAGRPVSSPVLPDTAGVTVPAAPTVNRAEAERILDEAGWKRGDDGTRSKGTVKLVVNLTTVDDPAYVAVADALKAQWQAVGAVVTIDAVDPTRFPRDVVKARKYSALLFAEQIGLDSDPYPFWHSSQQRDPGLNLSTFFRKDIDEAIERFRAAKDDAARATALSDFRQKFAEEQPALVLYQSEELYVAPHRLGIPTDLKAGIAADRFNGVAEWFVRRRLNWK